MSPRRLRRGVVTAKADLVRALVARMDTLPLGSVDELTADQHMVAAGESYLRRALEALLDLGRHLLAKAHGVPAVEYQDVPRQLGRLDVLDADEVDLLMQMAGYRNRLTHLYHEVSADELHQVISRHRHDLLRVVEALEEWIRRRPELVDEEL